MVTLDDKIENVGEFKGDLQAGRRDYERAKQGSELVAYEKSELEEALKAHTGFSELNLPKKPTETTIIRDDVKFVIVSRAKTRRPPYKEAVTEMEDYLRGIYFLIHQGMNIRGVFQRDELTFVQIEKLFEAFNIIVGGIFEPGVEHTIRYELQGALAEEGPLEELTLRAGRNPGALTAENFANYIRMERLYPILVQYVKAYEAALTKGQRKPERTTPITSRSAYVTTKSKARGPDWAHVVKTLITAPVRKATTGEINTLADPTIGLAEKKNRFPYYELTYRRDEPSVLYVSIQSVSDRINSLLEGPPIESKRLRVEPREIV